MADFDLSDSSYISSLAFCKFLDVVIFEIGSTGRQIHFRFVMCMNENMVRGSCNMLQCLSIRVITISCDEMPNILSKLHAHAISYIRVTV